MAEVDYKKLSMDEIVFEGRNKSYGAFELRQLIDRHKLTGLLIAVAFYCFIVLSSQFKLFSFLTNLAGEKEVNIQMTNVELPPPPPPPLDVPPPPPPPPPVRPTIKFVEMIAKKDEEVVEEEPITKQEEIKETQVSTTTQEGDKNAKVIIEDAGPGPVEPEQPKEPEIFDRAEVNPSFPGGPTELLKFLQKNIKYPSLARENGLEGKVIVKFYVDVDGTVREPVVLKDGVGGGCAEEAIRVCKSMPKWTPGSQRGKNVKVYYTLPVTFKLQ